MKRLLAILLACVMTMGVMVIPASADDIYYPCYEGEWYAEGNTEGAIKLEIIECKNGGVDFLFQYYQFAVQVHGNFVDDKTVKASYNEIWEGGDFIVNGDITLNLGDKSIWLDWHSYENGRDNGTEGFMLHNLGFKYQTISSQNIKVIVNGHQLTIDQNPVILNDRVLVPMRAIFEALGATVTWVSAKRNHGDCATADKGNKSIVLEIDSTYMSISENGKPTEITLDTPSILYNGYTFVPVRAVSEAFDADVSWDGNTKTVNISVK